MRHPKSEPSSGSTSPSSAEEDSSEEDDETPPTDEELEQFGGGPPPKSERSSSSNTSPSSSSSSSSDEDSAHEEEEEEETPPTEEELDAYMELNQWEATKSRSRRTATETLEVRFHDWTAHPSGDRMLEWLIGRLLARALGSSNNAGEPMLIGFSLQPPDWTRPFHIPLRPPQQNTPAAIAAAIQRFLAEYDEVRLWDGSCRTKVCAVWPLAAGSGPGKSYGTQDYGFIFQQDQWEHVRPMLNRQALLRPESANAKAGCRSSTRGWTPTAWRAPFASGSKTANTGSSSAPMPTSSSGPRDNMGQREQRQRPNSCRQLEFHWANNTTVCVTPRRSSTISMRSWVLNRCASSFLRGSVHSKLPGKHQSQPISRSRWSV